MKTEINAEKLVEQIIVLKNQCFSAIDSQLSESMKADWRAKLEICQTILHKIFQLQLKA